MKQPSTRWSLTVSSCALTLMLPWLAEAQEGSDLEHLRDRALTLVNEARLEEGLNELQSGEALDEAAQAHAEDMLERGYYDHVSPEGETVLDRYLAAGGSEWELVMENIARCAGCPVPPEIDRVDRLHQGWMGSPEHRDNILSDGVAWFGFGLAAGPDEDIYAVQTFAGPGTDRGDVEPSDDSAIDPVEVVGLALAFANEVREESGAPALVASEALTDAARTLMPEDLSGFELDALGDPFEGLPEDERDRWAALASIASACGGCGTQVTQGDMRSFLSDWLDEDGYRDRLLDAQMTHLGVALRANGSGRKVALALIGQEH